MLKNRWLSLLVIALTIPIENVSASAFEEDEAREALLNRVNKSVKVYNKAFKREVIPGRRADILVDLKADLTRMSPNINTAGLSQQAIALYKEQERTLSQGLNPMDTPLEYFMELDEASFQMYYLDNYDGYLTGHRRLLRLTILTDLYRKIGDVYRMDGQISKADRYYLLGAHILVEGLHDYTDHEYLSATLRWVTLLLQSSSIYEDAKKPVISWALDTFKLRNKALADKIFDMVYCCEIEPVTTQNLFFASYYSFLMGDETFAHLYEVNGIVKMSNGDPLLDSNVGNRAERLSNRIMLDVMDVLLAESQLKANNRVLIQKWTNMLEDGELVQNLAVKRIATPLGMIPTEDLVNGVTLYKRVRALHQVQHKIF